jgi:hypothetical protein
MPLFIAQFLGCIVIGYMSWVLATSTTVNRFLSGTLVRTWWTFMRHVYCFGSFAFIFACELRIFMTPPLDFYVYGDRAGILPVYQRTRRMGRHSQPKRMARSIGTSGNFSIFYATPVE